MTRLSRRLLLVAACFLALSARAHGQSLFFQVPTYAGGGPIAADLNGDGKPDLISADGTVQLGNGDGTFKTGIPWTTGQNLGNATDVFGGFAVVDFNGDGKPDLLVAEGTSLFVLFGNGDGTFQTAIATNIGTGLNRMFVGDFNGDGKPDVAGFNNSGLFVALGNANGTFGSVTQYTLCPVPSLLTGGDFNGDGHIDLVVACSLATPVPGSGTLQIFLGKGDGTFSTSPSTSTGVPTPDALVTGDFNGDGKLDLALADGFSGQTFILLGNGDGTFQTTASPLPAQGALAAADVNGDHKLDLIILNGIFAEAFLGNGDGTFTMKDGDLLFQQQPNSIAVADFNGDGKLDLAAGNAVLLGNGDGTFQGDFALSVLPQGFSSGAAGDFNGDGKPDLAMLTNITLTVSTSSVYILLGDGTGKLSVAHTYALSLQAASRGAIAAADFNGDGKLDLAIVTIDPHTQDWTLNILLGNGDGSFAPPMTFAQGVPLCCNNSGLVGSTIAIADLNRDRKPDIVVLNSNSNELEVFLGNGDGTFAAPANYFAGSGVNSFLIADVNNDGIPDLATDSPAGLGILLGKGDGTFQSATFTSSFANAPLLAAADFNLDGNIDLLAGGILQVFLGNGDGTFRSAPPTTTATPTSSASVADVNGDGIPDVVQLQASNLQYNTDTLVQVFLGKGDGTFSGPIAVQQPDNGANFALVADFNQDKRPDIAVAMGGGITTILNTSAIGPDFVIAADSTPLQSVFPGQTATYSISATPSHGFNQTVALICSGAPALTTCSISPSSLQLNGTSPSTAMVTITTTAPSMGHLLPPGRNDRLNNPRLQPLLVGLVCVTLIIMLVAQRRSAPLRRVTPFAFVALLLLAATLSSCGGGSSGSTGGTSSPGTAAGTYTITVTGTAGTGSSATSHTTTLTLVVQ